MHKARRTATALLGFVLLASGCTSSPGPANEGYQTTTVHPGEQTVLTLDGGVTLTIPAGSTASDGTARGRTDSSPTPPPTGTTGVGDARVIELVGTTLTGSVKLSFPAPGHDDPTTPDNAVLTYLDKNSGQWTPVESAYDPATGMVTATVNHLSFWRVLRPDFGAIKAKLASGLDAVVRKGDRTDNPACDNENGRGAAGVSVTSSDGDVVKWCVGVTGGTPLVKVANNRGYALELNYPSTWTPQRTGPASDLGTTIATKAARFLSAAPRGRGILILPSGAGVEFTMAAGVTGTAAVQQSAPAYIVSGLAYAVQTGMAVAGTLEWAGAKAAPGAAEKIATAILDSTSCISDFQNLASNDASSARAVAGVFVAASKVAFDCFGRLWEIGYEVAGAAARVAVTVVQWLATGVGLVLQGVESLLEINLIFNPYRLTVSQRANTPATPLSTLQVPAPTTNTRRTYTNVEFGYSVEIPGILSPQVNGESQNGITYQGADTRIDLVLAGYHNGDGHSLDAEYANTLALYSQDNTQVTYKNKHDNVFTIAGISGSGQNIFYNIVYVGPTAIDRLRWVYPTSQKDALDASVALTASTFRPGPL